jgi:mannose-6-phosphate isomerase-like protein (cupin superfamily)
MAQLEQRPNRRQDIAGSSPAERKVPVPHSHDRFEETIYGLEGVCSCTIDGQTRALRPGESVCIRRGHLHRFENRGGVDARFLAIATPGVFGAVQFRDIRSGPRPRDGRAARSGGDRRGNAPPRADPRPTSRDLKSLIHVDLAARASLPHASEVSARRPLNRT